MWRRATGTPMLTATARWESAVSESKVSDTEFLWVPFQAKLTRRGHVPDERRCGDHGGARQIAFAANAHAVLPVAVERGNRPLAGVQRVGTLTETGTAPRLANLAARGSKHVRDRFAPEPRIRAFDLPRHAARSRENHERFHRPGRALAARAADYEGSGEQIVVAAVGAGTDHRLVERQPLARDLFGRKRVARAERLRDHGGDVGEIDRLVQLEGRVGAWRKRRIRQI